MSAYLWTQADQTPEIDDLANEAGIAAEEAKTYCLWTEDSDTNWDSACGHTFFFDEDGPEENGFKYCCWCGKILIANHFDFDNEDGGQ